MAGTQEQREADAALVPSDTEIDADAPVTAGLPSDISPAQVMMLLTQLVQAMPENIAAAVKKDDKHFSHSDNVKLDIRNFARIKTFTNKHDSSPAKPVTVSWGQLAPHSVASRVPFQASGG